MNSLGVAATMVAVPMLLQVADGFSHSHIPTCGGTLLLSENPIKNTSASFSKRCQQFILHSKSPENNDEEHFSSQYHKDDKPSIEKKRRKQEEEECIRRRRHRNFEQWGVENFQSSSTDNDSTHHPNNPHHPHWSRETHTPVFPSTFEALADECFHAIAGTIYGMQRPDPNVASNAMHRSVLDYRPTHPPWASSRRWAGEDDSRKSKAGMLKKPGRKQKTGSSARIGIEVDGAAYLFPTEHNLKAADEGRAIRILSLEIASRLAASTWEGYDELKEDEIDESGETHANGRPVAIYYNSLEKTLLASRELRRLKRDQDEKIRNKREVSFDNIQICCLTQHSLPENMIDPKKKSTQSSTSNKGIILIVKPTDYDTDSQISIQGSGHSSKHEEHNSYQPAIQANIVDKLQSILFQASASSLPAVVLSPRLSELPPLQQSSHNKETGFRTGPSGFEQSGYQRSATYGGAEPPVGPTPWLLRDLSPSAYVWVGSSYNVMGPHSKSRNLRSIAAAYHRQREEDTESAQVEKSEKSMTPWNDAGDVTCSFYSRVALTQSTMDVGHSWHMFAVEEKVKGLPSLTLSSFGRGKDSKVTMEGIEWDSSYQYMASTKASSGRPNSAIVKDVFAEWSENNH